MEKEPWLKLAKTLQEGTSRRCDCPSKHCITLSSNTAKVSNTSKGYFIYCFACNSKKLVKHGLRSLSQLRLTKEVEEFKKAKIQIPNDFTDVIPQEYAVWLYKSGVFANTAKKYGIGWSPKLHRIVLPVYSHGKLSYIQARAVDKHQYPKYLNKESSDKHSIVLKSLVEPSEFSTDLVVVTEAILSAIRVGVVAKAWSTLGSTLTDEVAYQLCNTARKVLIWYDPDIAGITASIRAKRKLELLGVQTSIIKTDKKPKCYSNSEIANIVRTYNVKFEKN